MNHDSDEIRLAKLMKCNVRVSDVVMETLNSVIIKLVLLQQLYYTTTILDTNTHLSV